jgi:hypothetical protein
MDWVNQLGIIGGAWKIVNQDDAEEC